MPSVRSHPVAATVLVFLFTLLAASPSVLGQTCGVTGGGSTQMPAYTGTSFGLITTGGSNRYVYAVTEWGIARFSLANPAAPSGGNTGMIGIDGSQGVYPTYNGGKVPVHTDSHQGATWFAAAEASDGSARALTDWSPALNQGDSALQGQVVMAAGGGLLSFGQQVNVPRPPSSGFPIGVASIGSSFFGYSSTPSGLSITNLTSPTGDPGLIGGPFGSADPALGIQPIGSFNAWGALDSLAIANVTVGGLPQTLLVGEAGGTLHVGTINANGSVTDGPSIVTTSFVYSISIANVGNKAVIFTAEGSSGIRGYEFTGTTLVASPVFISGNYDFVAARGSYPSLIILAHKSFNQMETYDTKWMLTGNAPIAGPVSQHNGSPNNYFGKWAEAVVVGNTAYLYRVGNGLPEKNLYTTILDVSCITADLTSPPTASATFVNKSAQLRSGVEATINYYGDRFVFTDASASGTPITRVDWDLNTAGTVQTDFVPDVSLGTTTSIGGVPGLLYPCDPAGGGDPVLGTGCRTSVGLTTTPGPASFKFGEKSSNVNGAALNAFFSPAISFVMPQANVANMVGGTLSILTGGSADSTPTQGHPVSWQWSFSGGSGGSSTLPVAPVPSGTTSFSLTVGYEGGYTASTSGNVAITDLVPSFSMSPASVNLAGFTTLTNTMQIATGGVVTSVDYSLVSGPCPQTPSFTNSLPATFNVSSGTAQIQAPATAGTYCVALRYHYTPFQGSPTISPTLPTATLTVQNAVLTASVNVNPASVAPNTSTTATATVSGGVPPYFYQWDCNYSTFSGGNFGSPSSSNFTACSWATSGGRTPGVKITDSATPSVNITVFGNATVTGSTGGALSVNISGPTSTPPGTAQTYTAFGASGGTGVYSYAWNCDLTPAFPTYNPGSSSVSCTYPNGGTKLVGLKMTDSASASVTRQYTVVVSGGSPGPGGLSVSVTGATTGSQNQTITFTGTGTGGTAPYTYQWSCDYSASFPSFSGSGSTHPCTYTTNGPHITGAKVTDATSATAIGTITTTIAGPPLPSTAFTITGGTISGTTLTVGVGQPVTFTSSEANCDTWGWAFGDGTAGTGKSITKSYPTKGTFTGQIVVHGNGTGAQGTNVAGFTVQVVTPAPSGAFTIAGAQANGNGTVFTANVGDTLTMSAAEPGAITWGWDFGDGTLGAARSVTKAYGTLGSYTVKLFVTGNERDTTGLTISTFTINVVSCVTNATTLCLNNNRFRATVDWAVPDQGKAGAGSAVSLTTDTGYYWFFSPANIELVLKVVDGRAFNGNFWVFYGALSDVQYDISIKDTTTGTVKTYHNPYHTTASVADVDAFPAGGSSAAPESKKILATNAPTVACVPATVTIGQPITCTASPAGTYTWEWGETFPLQFSPGPNPNTHTYNSVGTRTVTVTSDGGITQGSTTVAITTGGAGSIAAQIGGPSTGTTGAQVAFTATATGGTSPYTYAWNCDYQATNPSFAAGTASNTCSYTTAGVYTVGLKVTDSAATPGVGIATASITISAPAGPGLPSAVYTIAGATLNPSTNRYEAEVGRPVTFTAAEVNAEKWGWDLGDGAVAGGADPANRSVTYSYPQTGNYNGQLLVYGDTTHTIGISLASIPMSVLRCAGDAQTLCLNGGRFKVKVTWQSADSSGVGTAVPVTADTGQFWFITSNNIELVIKVVDGTSFNGHFWVFYGALSNLEYDITVTDTTTGTVKTYHNPLGTTASMADVNAF